MVDVFTPEKRSTIMASIKGGNTKPEVLVRRLLHSVGYRFRLHSDKLPGKPDIVLTKHRKIILVHGCFWHAHTGCRRAKLPSTNVRFWREKIERNQARDRRVIRKLRRMGWGVMVVWQCQTANVDRLTRRLLHFLE